jgi:hypothetical protein
MVKHTGFPDLDVIKIYDGNLSEDFCQRCVHLFEEDNRKYQGQTGKGYRPDVKKSLDLLISTLPEQEWREVDKVLHEALKEPAKDYFELLDEFKTLVIDPRDSGYQIQKTEPDGGYTWHNDAYLYEDTYARLFTYLWYLNTVEEGGETEFLDRKIKPVAGRLLLFPATWTYVHRGLAPKTGSKYICTGWMSSAPLFFQRDLL